MSSEALKIYYETIYPEICTPDSRFLASKEGLVFYSRIIEFLSLPIQILCTFCIIKKTPEQMKNVKSSLLKVNLWSIFSGIILGFLVIPLNFFPSLSGVFIGLTEKANPVFQFCLFMAILFGILTSITTLFENRSSLIAQNRFAISKASTRNLWIFINFFGNIALLAPVFLNLPDQENTKLEILKRLPCPAKEFFTESMLILAYQDVWESYLTGSFFFIYFNLMAQILFFSICCIYYLFIFKSSQVSAQTRKIQIQSFFAIIFQSLIPILFDYIPTMIFLDRQRKNNYDQLNNNLMGLSIIMHNGMTSLSILLVQKPYRNYLKSIFVAKKKSEATRVFNVSGERRL